MYRVWLKQTMWFRRRQTFEKGQDRQPNWWPFKCNRLKKNLIEIISMKTIEIIAAVCLIITERSACTILRKSHFIETIQNFFLPFLSLWFPDQWVIR